LRKLSLFLGSFFIFGLTASGSPLNLLELGYEHRVLEKVIKGKSQWEGYFCQGVYEYRILLKTQISRIEIDLEEDGSVSLEAELGEPYIGFQGNYQGAYSLCLPLGAWSGIRAENATIKARIYFFEQADGRVEVKVDVKSLQLGQLMTNALAPSIEKNLTDTLNQGLEEVWSSQLGEWANTWISDILNQNIPIDL